MICLDNTDVIEGGASVDAVIDYQLHGLVGSTFTQLAAGVMNTTLTTVLYTAGAAISVVSIILVNKHTSAVNVTLCLDPANGGNPRYIIPKTISLGVGYLLTTDGVKFNVYNAEGALVISSAVDDTAYAAGWNGETKVAPSKNAIYDKLQTILGDVTAAANITANTVVVGDDGAKGVKELSGTIPLAQGGSGTTGDSILKAWVKLNGTGTIAIFDSFNIASLTDNGVGDYQILWDTDFANANYACTGTTVGSRCVAAVSYETANVRIQVFLTSTLALQDENHVCVYAIGDQ